MILNRLGLITILFLSVLSEARSNVEGHVFRIVIAPYAMSITNLASKKPLGDGEKIKVLIENSSLSDVWGKVESIDGEFREFVNIPNQQGRSVEIRYKKTAMYRFTSLSPSYQDAVLNPSGKSYEIPAKKSD